MNELQVLETKLYAPRAPATLVSRPRLTDRVRTGALGRLTIVSAPAGSGKTTLLAELATESGAGWVSLDQDDNNPALFWTCVIRALQKSHPDLGESCIASLAADGTPAVPLLKSLINDIAALQCDVTLILDDYHVIDAAEIHTSLAFFVDHMPQHMHVIIATRVDPLLPLARLRARGEMVELRSDDLRFNPLETSAFLNSAMELELASSDVKALEKRTEGWVAGLKLAALSMKSHADRRGFIDAFSGNTRYVADYLVEEVLNSQPPHVRRFLLATAILERMNGAVCDAVTGERTSQALLEDLEARNLFVVALDDQREWYRYHHLFAEVLLAHATREDPAGVHEHHRRASVWYEQNGSISSAIRHARLADDLDRVASLLERHWPAMDRSYHTLRWLDLVKSLPSHVVDARPMLVMGYAWALLNAGELEAAEARLTSLACLDLAQYPILPREITTARIYLAQSRGDAAATLELAKQLVTLVPAEDHAATAVSRALLALSYWAEGALDDAYTTFSGALDAMRANGDMHSVIRGVFVLGDLRAMQFQIDEAERLYRSGLALATEHASADVSETDELYIGLAMLHLERNELADATELLLHIERSASNRVHQGNRHRWCIAMSRVAFALGNLERATELLDEAEREERRDPVPRVRPVTAMRARVALARGMLADAEQWALDAGVTGNDAPSFLREYEHIVYTRLLLTRFCASGDTHALTSASALLERLAGAALTGGRTAHTVEILILQGLVHDAAGRDRAAVDALSAALELAEPVAVIRPFIAEGRPIRELLRQPAVRAGHGAFARRILTVLAEDGADEVTATAKPVDLLTKREIEILKLIAAGMRNEDIATHLFISTSTAKRHIANIYAKLDAHHRTEALNRAAELRLF